MTDNNNTDFNKDLINLLSTTRDVSLRDGHQSLDGSRWRIEDRVPIARMLNELNVLVKSASEKEFGSGGILEMPDFETWGGANIKEAARLNGEDPVENLKKLHAAMPDANMQCLYRGDQAYGYKPEPEDVQEASIRLSAKGGINTIRIFDMMNDMENLKIGFAAIKKIRAEQDEAEIPKDESKRLQSEGCICYISEPKGKKRVWEVKDYIELGEKLVAEGADKIAIKDYAGLLTVEEVTEIVKGLRDAGIKQPIAIHSHGNQSEVLSEALKAGATTVDIAFGELSRGSSHTNMFDFIERQLGEKYNLDNDEIKNNPIMQQLHKIEEAIDITAQPYIHTSRSKEAIDPELIKSSRIAGAAIVPMINVAKGEFDRNQKLREAVGNDFNAFFELSLKKMSKLWEAAGRPNTVTPGSKILSDLAVQYALFDKVYNIEPPLSLPQMKPYQDLVMGRFGRNKGLEDGIAGDKKQLNLFLVEDTLKVMNSIIDDGILPNNEAQKILEKAGSSLEIFSQLKDQSKIAEIQADKLHESIGSELTNLTYKHCKDKLLLRSKQGQLTKPKNSMEAAYAQADKYIDRFNMREIYSLGKDEKIPEELRTQIAWNIVTLNEVEADKLNAEYMYEYLETGKIPEKSAIEQKPMGDIENAINSSHVGQKLFDDIINTKYQSLVKTDDHLEHSRLVVKQHWSHEPKLNQLVESLLSQKEPDSIKFVQEGSDTLTTQKLEQRLDELINRKVEERLEQSQQIAV